MGYFKVRNKIHLKTADMFPPSLFSDIPNIKLKTNATGDAWRIFRAFQTTTDHHCKDERRKEVVIVAMVISPLDDPTYCARSGVTHLGI